LFVKKLETVANEIKEDERWREVYMQSLLRERDTFERGVEQERVKAEADKIEIAKSLLQSKMSLEEVARHLKLPLVEVEKLLME